MAQVLVGPSKQIIQTEHNIVKNPNWQVANQLAIYKRARGFELGATEKQIQIVVRAGLEPPTAGLRVRPALTTRPRCLLCETNGNEHLHVHYHDFLVIFRLLEHISATKSERFQKRVSSLINIQEVTF